MHKVTLLVVVVFAASVLLVEAKSVKFTTTRRDFKDRLPYRNSHPRVEPTKHNWGDQFINRKWEDMDNEDNYDLYTYPKRMRRAVRGKFEASSQQKKHRPGCCQCGDHICCDYMCHGK